MTLRRCWTLAVSLIALSACRDRGGGEERPDSTLIARPAVPLELELAAPDTVGWNRTDSLRLTLANRTQQPVSPVIWLTLPLGLTVDSTAGDSLRHEGGSTRLRVVMADVPSDSTGVLAIAFRMPAAPPAGDSAATAFPVEAAAPALALVARDTVHARPGSEVVAGGCATAGGTSAQRYGVGPVRVRMPAASLRAACPEARDSSWQVEGEDAQGLIVLVGGAPVLAEVAGDSVRAIVVADARVRTATGVGVGSTFAELRARHGTPCVGIGDGPLYVWFPTAPGISFGLDSLTTRAWRAGGGRPEALPDTAHVASYLVHGEDSRCPTR